MKVVAEARTRTGVVSFGRQMFGLRIWPRPRLHRLPDWLCSRPEAEWGSVMRYRSATVAGLHGLPCDC